MKKKVLQLLVGITISASVMGGCIGADRPAMAAEEKEVVTEVSTVTATEEIMEAEKETGTSDFVEGSAVLQDYDYKKGELTENGWESTFLGMKYEASKDISMGIKENEKISEYHARNGEEKKVADSEMVALDKEEGYIQIMAEVNPNNESAEDILGRFTENEKLDLVSKTKEMEIGGKAFQTCTGIFEKEKYIIGVSTDTEDIVIAIKAKYKDTAARKTLLERFAALEEVEDAVTEESDTEFDGMNLDVPEEFKDNIVIETETETATETK